MLFFVQMRWNYQGRISQDQLWDLEALEGEHGMEGVRSGFVQLYKVVSQHRIIAIVRADSLDDLDRNSMGWLPMREYLEFEAVWALRDYEGFLDDVKAKFPPPGARPPALPTPTQAPANEAMTRAVVDRWFGALGRGDGAAALACLADDVVWLNGPGIAGLSDIVPWLGEFHGRAAVEASFVVWNQLSQVRQFEVRKVVFNGDEAFAVIHEVATIKATGLDYDIEFIQRIRVANDRIASWHSYWDTARGIVPFRGDMRARLIRAAERGDRDEAMLVLPFGADPNTVDPTSGLAVLAIAAARGHEPLVRCLLDHGAEPNLTDRRGGGTALHKACQGGHAGAARMLVEAGAWIDAQVATTGHTPLLEAIWFKSVEIVRDLLNRDARIDLKTYYGFTLDDHIAYALKVSRGATDQKSLARIQDLVAQRRARDRRRQEGAALVRAALAGDRAGLEAALEAGAGLEERFPVVGGFEDGHTALLVAARDGHEDCVADLVAAGADVNAVEPVFGAVPLHKATYNGHAGITRQLATAAGIHLDARGASNGYTPLLDALWHGFADCAAILLDAGARTDLVGDDGTSARDLAAEKLGPDHPLVARLGAVPSPVP